MSDPRVATRGGWMRIVKNFWDAMVLARFSPNEMAVFGMLIRNTYGKFSSSKCEWSVRKAAEETYLSRREAERAWSNLKNKNVVVCYREHKGTKPGLWGPNEEFWEWKNMPVSFRFFLDKVAAIVSPSLGDTRKTETVTLDPPMFTTSVTLSAQNGDTNPPQTVTLSAQNGDTSTSTKAVYEGIVGGPEDRDRDRDMESVSCVTTESHAPFSYGYCGNDKSEQGKFRNHFLEVYATNLIPKIFTGGTIVPKQRARIIDVIEMPTPDGFEDKVWRKILVKTFKEVMLEAHSLHIKGGCREPISWAVSGWRGAISIAANDAREMPAAPSAPPVTRKRDRRFVVEPPRMNLPIMGSWRACYADEITDEDRARFLREESECQKALEAHKARQAEIEAQNPKPERRKRP